MIIVKASRCFFLSRASRGGRKLILLDVSLPEFLDFILFGKAIQGPSLPFLGGGFNSLLKQTREKRNGTNLF